MHTEYVTYFCVHRNIMHRPMSCKDFNTYYKIHFEHDYTIGTLDMLKVANLLNWYSALC